jgi:hypothetical protein
MEEDIADQSPTRTHKSHIPAREKNIQKNKVLPGIEPGLPEDTDFRIRIRSDVLVQMNLHYKTEVISSNWLSVE